MPDGELFLGTSLRQLPTNLEAEQALLGAIMRNEKSYSSVSEFLRQEHFADALHGRMFAEMGRRISAGGVATAIALKTWYEADPEYQTQPDYLSVVFAAMVAIINAKEYGEEILRCAQRRAIIAACENGVNGAFDNSKTLESVATEAAEAIDQVIADSGSKKRRSSFSISEAIANAVAAGDRARERGGFTGLSTGFRGIDERIGGLEDGALYVLAGRPAMGKTALGTQIALSVAQSGIGVLMVSLEMQADQLGRRVLASVSGVPGAVLKSGRWSQDHANAIAQAQNALHGVPLTIEDCPGLNSQAIAAKARAAHRKHGLGLLVVDHLHIVATPSSTEKMGATWAVGQVSNALKRIAKEMSIPVLALAQLNRGVESREDKRPNMSDLRQSGEIEQDAEAIMLLYREEYYLSKSEPEKLPLESEEKFAKRRQEHADKIEKARGKAELILPKIRDGEPGTVDLMFDGARTEFREIGYND